MFAKLIDKAIVLSDLPQGKFKHFSFIMRRNKILSIGWNLMNKSHPWTVKYGYEFSYIHSELMAVRNFPYQNELSKCRLINLRLVSKNKIALSKPCIHCAKFLCVFNLKEVWYTTNSGKFIQL